MQNLIISYLQFNAIWEDIDANIQRLNQWVDQVPENGDLWVLPEMFSTGFTMQPQNHAEGMDGKAVSWMLEKAAEKNICIAGSLVISENEHYFNRFVFAKPNGDLQYYDKRHLFSLTGEHETYTKGEGNIQVDIKGWKIRPLVCYDLRFPVWSKNDSDYDLLLYSANWPVPRIAHWKSLLVARAIENQSYVLGVNRFGEDKNGLQFNGNSLLVDPMGEIKSNGPEDEALITVELNYEAISSFRKYLSVLQDSDRFEVLD